VEEEVVAIRVGIWTEIVAEEPEEAEEAEEREEATEEATEEERGLIRLGARKMEEEGTWEVEILGKGLGFLADPEAGREDLEDLEEEEEGLEICMGIARPLWVLGEIWGKRSSKEGEEVGFVASEGRFRLAPTTARGAELGSASSPETARKADWTASNWVRRVFWSVRIDLTPERMRESSFWSAATWALRSSRMVWNDWRVARQSAKSVRSSLTSASAVGSSCLRPRPDFDDWEGEGAREERAEERAEEDAEGFGFGFFFFFWRLMKRRRSVRPRRKNGWAYSQWPFSPRLRNEYMLSWRIKDEILPEVKKFGSWSWTAS